MGNIKTFQVTSTSPVNGASSVDINSNITITFNTDVDRLTMFNSIRITEHLTGVYVPGIPQYDNNRNIILKTNEPFKPGTEYDVHILKTLKNILGNVCRDYTFTFKTVMADLIIGAPKLISPSDMETILTKPAFKWESVPGAIKYEIELSGSYEFSNVLWTTIVDRNTPDTQNMLIEKIPTYITEESKLYFWRVRAAIYNLEGDIVNSIWSDTFRFTSVSENRPVILDEDNLPLPEDIIDILVETFPEDEFSNVGVNIKSIYITIDKILDPTKIDPRSWLIVGKHVTGDDLAPDWSSSLSSSIKRYNHGQLVGSWSVIIDEDNSKTIIVFQPNTL